MSTRAPLLVAGDWIMERLRRDLHLPAFPQPDDAIAEQYAQKRAAADAFRREGGAAIAAGDYRRFFTAAAECAKAMNRAGRIVDQA